MKPFRHIHLSETTSTNAALSQMLQQQIIPEFTILTADIQTMGRGHGGSLWESEPGKNLIFSTVWYPLFVKPEDQFRISIASSLAVLDLVASYANGTTIKWPNDVYIGAQKVAGILIEHSFSGSELQHSIIGIGINVLQQKFLSDAPNPISLKQATGQNFTPGILIDRMSSFLQNRYEQMKHDPLKQKQEYISHLYRYDIWARYESKDGIFRARITDILQYGWLELEFEDGKRISFAHKEVRFL